LAASGRLDDGSSVSTPVQPVPKMLQPPSATGFFDARRITRVPQSLVASSTLSPSFLRSSYATNPCERAVGVSTASRTTIFSQL
jgi:hypothetical protein